MKIQSAFLYLTILASAIMVAGAGAKTQAGSQAAPNAETPQNLISSVEGADLFPAYCASCHGKDGRGHGPAAPALKATVPDLTVIAANNGGKFPEARVRRIIIGEGMIASHGSREMPVWGPIFSQVEADVDRGPVRVQNLVKYLESIQVKTKT